MQIRLTGRHMEVSPSTRDYAEDKFGHLPRFYDRLGSLDVTVEPVHGDYHIKAVLHVEHHAPMVAESRGRLIPGIIDEAVGELERQLKRLKEQLRNDRKHANQTVRGGLGSALQI